MTILTLKGISAHATRIWLNPDLAGSVYLGFATLGDWPKWALYARLKPASD